MDKELEIRISKDGKVSIETFGMTGPTECSKMVEKVTLGLGGTGEDDKKKPEYWDDGRKVYIRGN